MNASAPSVSRLDQDVKGIRTRHQSIHLSFGQQYLFAGCERRARLAHNAGRTDILIALRYIDAQNLGHEDVDITNGNTEIDA
jgi:hypothetical protein